MPELRQEYLDILEKREWSVSGYTDDGRVELEWWSPAGEDFLVCVNVENFPDEILDYSDDFDPDEHIEMWLEARANGRKDKGRRGNGPESQHPDYRSRKHLHHAPDRRIWPPE